MDEAAIPATGGDEPAPRAEEPTERGHALDIQGLPSDLGSQPGERGWTDREPNDQSTVELRVCLDFRLSWRLRSRRRTAENPQREPAWWLGGPLSRRAMTATPVAVVICWICDDDWSAPWMAAIGLVVAGVVGLSRIGS